MRRILNGLPSRCRGDGGGTFTPPPFAQLLCLILGHQWRRLVAASVDHCTRCTALKPHWRFSQP